MVFPSSTFLKLTWQDVICDLIRSNVSVTFMECRFNTDTGIMVGTKNMVTVTVVYEEYMKCEQTSAAL